MTYESLNSEQQDEFNTFAKRLNQGESFELASSGLTKLNSEMIAYGKAAKQGEVSASGFNLAMATQGKMATKVGATTKLASAGKALLGAAGNMAILTIFVKLAEGIYNKYKSFEKKNDQIIADSKKARQKYDNDIKKQSNTLSDLENNKSLFNTLSKGVDNSGSNIGLTSDQYEKFSTQRVKILKQFPSLIEGYDSEGNAIANNNTLMQKAIELQEKKVDAAKKEKYTDSAWAEQAKAYQTKLKNAESGDSHKVLADALSGGKKNDSFGLDNYRSGLQEKLRDLSGFKKSAEKVLGKKIDINSDEDLYSVSKNIDEILKGSKGLSANENIIDKYVGTSNKDMILYSAGGFADKYKDLQDAVSDAKTEIAKLPDAVENFDELDTTKQNFLSSLATNWDVDKDTDIEKVKDKYTEIAQKVKDDSTFQKEISDAFSLNSKSTEKSAKDWADGMQTHIESISKTTGQSKSSIAKIFGLETDDSGSILADGKNVSSMITELKDEFKGIEGAQDYFDSLNFDNLNDAYQTAIAGTETFTGSLDQLKERIKLLNKLKPSNGGSLSSYLSATETANEGDDYLSIRDALKSTKDSYDKGLVGTDDFKTGAAILSPTGAEDADNFIENYQSKMKYFTEDSNGIKTFLEDLSSKTDKAGKSFATFDDSTGKWKVNIKNTAEAAKKMGLGIEAFESVLKRGNDYGADFKFESVTEQYDEATKSLDDWAQKWKDNGGSNGDEQGQEIEEYRQKLIEFKNTSDSIPDDWQKTLSIKVNIAQAQAELEEKIGEYDNQKDEHDKSWLKSADAKEDRTDIVSKQGTVNSKTKSETSDALKKNGREFSEATQKQIDEYNQDIKDALKAFESNNTEENKEKYLKASDTRNDYMLKASTDTEGKYTISSKEAEAKKTSDEANGYIKKLDAVPKEIKTTLGIEDADAIAKVQQYTDKQEEVPKELRTTLKIDSENAESQQKINELTGDLKKTKDVNQKIKIHTQIEAEQDSIKKNLDDKLKNAGIGNTNEKGVKKVIKASYQIDISKTNTEIDNLNKKIKSSTGNKKAKLQVKLEAKKDSLNKQLANISKNPAKFTVKANTSAAKKEIAKVTKSLKNTKSKNVNLAINTKGDKKAEKANSTVKDMPKSKKSKVTVDVNGLEQLKDAKTAIDNIYGKTVTVTTKYVESGKKGRKKGAGSAHGNVSFAHGTSKGLNGRSRAFVQGTVSDLTDFSDWDDEQQAFAHGTTKKLGARALATGSLGASSSGLSLTGELGTELVVRGNRWFTVGENGAEFANIKRGDIIFNHEQTKDLLSNGKTSSRASIKGGSSAFAQGNAYAHTKVSGGLKFKGGASDSSSSKKNTKATNDNTKSKKKNTDANKKDTKSKTTALEKYIKKVGAWFDFVEIKLNNLSRATDMIANSITDFVSSTYKASQLMKQYNSVGKEITANEQGASKYKATANSIERNAIAKAPSGKGSKSKKAKTKKANQKRLRTYFARVRDGSININQISDENMRSAVESYQTWYDKYTECKQAVQELKNEQRDLFNQWLNMPIEEAQKKIDSLTSSYNVLTKAVSSDVLSARSSTASSGGSAIALLRNIDQQQIQVARNSVSSAQRTRSSAQSRVSSAQSRYNSAKKADNKASSKQKKEGKQAKKAIAKQRGLSSKKRKSLTKSINSGKKISTKGLKGKALKEAKQYNASVKKRASTKRSVSSASKTLSSARATLSSANNSYAQTQAYLNTLESAQAVQGNYANLPAYEYQNYLLNEQVTNKTAQNKANQDAVKKAQNNTTSLKSQAESAKRTATSKQKAVSSKGASILKSSKNRKKLSASQEKAIKAGKTVSTKGIKDKKLLKQLQDYNKAVKASASASNSAKTAAQKYQDSITALNTAINNAQQSEAELAQMRVENAKQSQANIKAYYDAKTAYEEGLGSSAEAQNKLKKQKGQDLSEADYQKEIDAKNKQRALLVEEQAKLQENLNKQVAAGNIKEGTQEWYEMKNEINNVGTEITNTDTSIDELKDTMRDDVFYRGFERALKASEALRNSIDAISGVISEDMMFDDDGNITKYGTLSLGMNIKDIGTYKNDLKTALARRAQLEKDKDTFSDSEWTEKMQDSYKEIADIMKNINSAESSVINAIKNQAKASLEAQTKVIEAYKKSLQSKKDYYDYDKQLKSSNKEIQLLKSKIAALNGVMDAESKAEKKRLEAELQEKTDAQNDTIKDHVYQLQVDGLDQLTEELNDDYEKYVKQLADDFSKIEKLINDATNTVTGNAQEISDTLDEILSHYGITRSDIGIDSAIPHFAKGGLVKATKRAGDDGLASLKSGEEVVASDTVKAAETVLPAMEYIAPKLDSIVNSHVLDNIARLQSAQYGMNPIEQVSLGEINVSYGSAIENINIDDLGGLSDKELQEVLDKASKYVQQQIVQDFSKLLGKKINIR